MLSIAGDIDVPATKALIEKYFIDIPRGNEVVRNYPQEPRQTAEVRDVVYDNIQLPAVIYAYHIPPQGTPNYYALRMLTTLMTGGASARMNKALIDEQQLGLNVSSFPFSTEDPGLILFFTIAKAGIAPEKVEAAMDAELDKLKQTPISARELQKIRNQAESRFVSSNATMAGIAESLANYHVYYGDANLINTELERFMQVTPADIQRVANDYLTKANRVTLYFMPKSAQTN